MMGRLLLSAMIALVGLWQIALSVYDFARHGYWLTASTLSALQFTPLRQWATNPADWLGIHQFLLWLPLWAACFALAIVVLMTLALD